MTGRKGSVRCALEHEFRKPHGNVHGSQPKLYVIAHLRIPCSRKDNLQSLYCIEHCTRAMTKSHAEESLQTLMIKCFESLKYHSKTDVDDFLISSFQKNRAFYASSWTDKFLIMHDGFGYQRIRDAVTLYYKESVLCEETQFLTTVSSSLSNDGIANNGHVASGSADSQSSAEGLPSATDNGSRCTPILRPFVCWHILPCTHHRIVSNRGRWDD